MKTPNRKEQRPSLYPDPSSYEAGQPAPPVNSAPPDSADALPPAYEVLLELNATLSETTASPPAAPGAPAVPHLPSPVSGVLRVVQGPLDSSMQPLPEKSTEPPSYHAFVSIGAINIPLLPTQPARRLSSAEPALFEIRIPSRVFVLSVRTGTEPELVDGLQRVLQWFCSWQDGTDAASVAGAAGAFAGEGEAAGTASSASSSQERFARAGDRGVEFVETLGAKINSSIQRKLTTSVEAARDTPPKDVKMGGKVTSKVLSGTRSVVGAGASLASTAADKLSGALGTGLAKNPVTKNMANAAEGSAKRRFHDNLMSGLLAFGRIYVAADRQGKIIIENTGHGTAEYAGAKYGAEAEEAARNLGWIALDGYRIARFPEKLGATGLLKGALKSTAQKETNPGGFGRPMEIQDGQAKFRTD